MCEGALHIFKDEGVAHAPGTLHSLKILSNEGHGKMSYLIQALDWVRELDFTVVHALLRYKLTSQRHTHEVFSRPHLRFIPEDKLHM